MGMHLRRCRHTCSPVGRRRLDSARFRGGWGTTPCPSRRSAPSWVWVPYCLGSAASPFPSCRHGWSGSSSRPSAASGWSLPGSPWGDRRTGPGTPLRWPGGRRGRLTAVATSRAGVWMYHCSTMPMSAHIANGLLGAVVIEPPDLPRWTAATCSGRPSCTSARKGSRWTWRNCRRRDRTPWSSAGTRTSTTNRPLRRPSPCDTKG